MLPASIVASPETWLPPLAGGGAESPNVAGSSTARGVAPGVRGDSGMVEIGRAETSMASDLGDSTMVGCAHAVTVERLLLAAGAPPWPLLERESPRLLERASPRRPLLLLLCSTIAMPIGMSELLSARSSGCAD